MPFFHVRIARKSNYPDEVRLDWTQEQIIQRVVEPYNQGRSITIGGKTLSLGDIERITVNQTKRASTECSGSAIIDHQLDQFNSYEWHLAAQGKDVTDDFITGPPGYSIEERTTMKQYPQSPTSMQVFISHSSFDIEVVKLLVELLRKALNLSSDDIRCTSLDGSRMPGGVSVDERLRAEVHDSELLIGVITPTSLKSAYVMFELGARWGAEKPMIPLLASGTTTDDLEGPLDKINALDGSQTGQLHQLVEEAAGHLSVARDKPSSYADAIEELARVSAIPSTSEQPSANDDTANLSEDAKELLLEAAKDTDGAIFFVETFGRSGIETNSRDFGEYRNPRSQARWKKALDELLGLALVEARGDEGNVFEVSNDGYQVADRITDQE